MVEAQGEAQGAQGEAQGEAQAIEGYGCTYGFRTTDNKEITRHVFNMSRQGGKGLHKSLGVSIYKQGSSCYHRGIIERESTPV